MVTKTYRGISLSANAVANGWPMPRASASLIPGRGDFAEREGGKLRRKEKFAVINAKRSWLNS